ncbi:MAG: di-trans,poly-cis-decaprenylcistransferase [Candidatus Paracaedibacteraceae bacterium]|nr:di-trans,poly-cis-decaprenylcistransferase [Candidatus Paracaedibacteraceae bacterium]
MEIVKNFIPDHVAIVLDGNGRWAKRQGLPAIAGHRQGAKILKKITRHADSMGVKYLTVFAFSTENWNRPPEWVDELMVLLKFYLKNEAKEIIENNIQFRILGRREKFSPEIIQLIDDLEKSTRKNTGITLTVALNYGGRDEIVYAIQKILNQQELLEKDITEDTITKNLLLPSLPPLDLFIRTSGEKRISNFLLWQLAYAELYFTDTLWPDFSENDLNLALNDYAQRDRRYGVRIGN